ncbi:hypothetical protein CU102_24040 [Phyllobacterium brassicacearum]|uniref:Uncharacterized protein n=1 Tax=Phyllobacterium brassicacearum TaxID=314235 RepID=A0A2P7BA48_9HYPH|nr:hypothetical protein [Phyllobacterium brassicacearum]PSH63337.1 hypothetical protein CU102_24040 [Phyllobacterium brassicacearum]TDQ18189.1 hypothetical protein DEV91_12552 [Phyllobacterium brassicacearum]
MKSNQPFDIIDDIASPGHNKRVWLAAMALSMGSEEATIAFSNVMFSLGEMNERHRHALLERHRLWEQLVDDGATETKRLFREMVDEKLRAWASNR